ncbi:hypothetical protein BD779DRAFT_1089919 [Infundibulicybe gibba]|nr:hypothetical protein BD779DRAFT_1089919 [Infundibulicybe gibba]
MSSQFRSPLAHSPHCLYFALHRMSARTRPQLRCPTHYSYISPLPCSDITEGRRGNGMTTQWLHNWGPIMHY